MRRTQEENNITAMRLFRTRKRIFFHFVGKV
jgi:hypothetical protein